ncbi:MAG: arsenite efflux transporter metallochaperone ArsD [Oligoflexia bacterium]|nr:arsenite efflux transporter metallochaperone ArsD [Oligoflexia bacterium]
MSQALRIFDPALCCSTGVCGPGVDPELVRFAADAAWLAAQGVDVQRFNLAQQPGAFVEPAVKAALQSQGQAALPLVMLGDQTVATGFYPSRRVLIKLLGLSQA